MKRLIALILCLVFLTVAFSGCSSDSEPQQITDVIYEDTAVISARELESITDTDVDLEIWKCTSVVDPTKQNTVTKIKKVRVEGAYARLIINELKDALCQDGFTLGDRQYPFQVGTTWLKIHGSLYLVGDRCIQKVKDVYYRGGAKIDTKYITPLIKEVFQYYEDGCNHYTAFYTENTTSKTLTVTRDFNFVTDVNMTVKDVYIANNTSEFCHIDLELISKTDKTVSVTLDPNDSKSETVGKTVSLKSGEPKTVTLKFHSYESFVGCIHACVYTVKTDGNVLFLHHYI